MYQARKFMLYWTALWAVALITTAVAAERAEAVVMSSEVVQIGPEQLYSDAQVWRVDCDVQERCTSAGQPIEYRALIKQMPIATWGWCKRDFCYGDVHLSDVIGLNPKYYTD